jgi:hypothetical protein
VEQTTAPPRAFGYPEASDARSPSRVCSQDSMRRRFLLARALLAALLALAAGARIARADDASSFGVNAHVPAGAQLAPQLDRVQQAGIGWIRIDFIWAVVEPQRGVFDWKLYDALVAAAQQRGLSILAILAYTPQWATDGPEVTGVPRDAADWQDFCARAAKRYRGKIGAWEVWNEPDLPKFWAGSRQQYWDTILIPGADAIHGADPQAKVAGPALAHVGSADWHHWLLQTLQHAGDKLDVVTHHLYDGDGFGDVTQKLDGSTHFGNDPSLWDVVAPSVREVLKQAGARGKPFWLTETGWQSAAVGEATQADDYRGLLGQWLGGDAARNWVQKIFFYELQDGSADFSWGILRANGSPKPAFDAYRTFTGGHQAAPELLLQNGRFAVQATWRTSDGKSGAGQPLPFSTESGRFWFFGEGNTELVVKLLDAATVNGHVWVYWGALSDVEYWLTVTDRSTGAVRSYHNAPGTLCGGADVAAFTTATAPATGAMMAADFTAGGEAVAVPAGGDWAPELAAVASPEAGDGAKATCASGPQTLCLGGNRFRVEAHWRAPNGWNGNAGAVAADADSGSFWFFGPGNLELAVKVLDGRTVNGKFWVYFGALSDVEYWVTVTDTATGKKRSYHNPAGTLCGQSDTSAF